MKEYTPQEDEDVYLDDLDEEKSSISKLLISVFIGFFAVGGLCLLGWVFFQGKTLSVEDTPIIKADKNPAKVKPDEPGGMVVANMDKTVYDNLSGNGDNFQKGEKVLPAPEEPVDRIQVISGQPKEKEVSAAVPAGEQPAAAQVEDITDKVKETDTATKVDTVASDMTDGQEEEGKAAASKPSPAVLSEAVKESSGDAVRPITESDLKLVPDAPVAKAQEAERPQQQQLSAKGGYKVQLAAFRTERDAVETWKKIQHAHSDLFDNLHYYIERKEVDGKGTFYRLQVGMIAKEPDARLLCRKLSEINQGCFVVE